MKLYTQEDLDAAVAREREECAKDVVEVVYSATGLIGGWIASPREVRNAIIGKIRARSAKRES